MLLILNINKYFIAKYIFNNFDFIKKNYIFLFNFFNLFLFLQNNFFFFLKNFFLIINYQT